MKISKEQKPHIWLGGAHFINDIYTGMLSPIMPFIAAKLSISMAIATIILSMSHICSSLLQPIFGFFADNMLKRVFIFWGLLLTSVFISFAPGASNIYTLLVFIVLGSLGSSLFHPQALGFSSRFATADATKAMGIFIGLGTLGFSLGPIVSAYTTQFLGLDYIKYLAVIGVIWAFMMFGFVPKISGNSALKTHNEFLTAFKDILTNRRLNILNIIAVLKTLVTVSCSILLPFLWKSMGYEPFNIGVALFAFSFAAGIGSFISRFVESKIGTKNVFYISMITPLPLMLLFAMFYNIYPIVTFLIFILIGFCTGMAMPVTMVLAQGELPQYKSIIGGFINGFSWGIVALVMSAVGFVAQAKGIVPVLLFITSIPAILSYFILGKLFTRKSL